MLTRMVVVAARGSRGERVGERLASGAALVARADDLAGLWRRLAQETVDAVLLRDADVEVTPALVAEIRGVPDGPDVVVLAREEDPEDRARLLRAGCTAVVHEGLDLETLAATLEALLARRGERMARELTQASLEPQLADYATSSPAMRAFLAVARRVVASDTTILLQGETGVGKEWLARALHAEGPRARGPFVAVNCGALPENLLESELFGHEKGAFTGAVRARRGHFEMAHGGTLFLDEIGELPAHLQVALLRVLQDRRIQPVGSERSIPVDVRVVAATNRDLEQEVAAGRFRPDLYYRLNVVALTLPPLRERREDIPELVQSHLDWFRTRLPTRAEGLDDDALAALCAYDWPGNVRELANAVERAVLMASGPRIGLADLPEPVRRAAGPGHAAAPAAAAADARTWTGRPWRQVREQVLEDAERRYLAALLEACEGRVGEVARRAGMAPRSLYGKLRRLGLHKEHFRPDKGDVPEKPATG